MKASNGLVILLSVVTVLAFAGLVPLGTWQDDFLYLHNYHQQGMNFLVDRLWHWSPRPLSETLIYFYALAVYHFGLPLIGVFTAFFWLVLIAAVLLPPWLGKRGLFISVVMLAMLLLGHPVTEFFYWPDGVTAYLPTLAAAALLLTLDWGGWSETRAGVAWTFVALMIAAASFEVGAMFTVVYVGLLTATRSAGSRRQGALLMAPLLLSLFLLYLQFSGRVSQASEVIGDPAVAHHPLASMIATAKRLPFELLKGDTLRHKYTGLAEGLSIKVLFFVGLYLAMSAQPGSLSKRMQKMRWILAIALLATAALTMAAALFNFGTLCCERHDTLRQNYVLIALGSLATLLAARWPSRHYRFAGPTLLLALVIPLLAVSPRLVAEYRDYGAIVQARDATWRSGRATGPDMTVTQTSPNLTGSLYIEPGIYHRTADTKTDARPQWMLIFFDKQSAEFTPPVNASRPTGGASH
jgi:hypothetical protein